MAMAFTFRVLENSARNYILQVNGVDAANTTVAAQNGTSAGIIAANGYTPTVHLKVKRLVYSNTNVLVRLQWHATSNVDLAIMTNDSGDLNLVRWGMSCQGMWNDGGVGVTGDIDIFTVPLATVAAGANPVTAATTFVLHAIKGA